MSELGPALTDLLRQLGSALHNAQREIIESGRTGMLALEHAEVEISFVVQKEVGGKVDGKTQWVLAALGAEADGKYRSDQVHKIKLQLKGYKPPQPAATDLSWPTAIGQVTSETIVTEQWSAGLPLAAPLDDGGLVVAHDQRGSEASDHGESSEGADSF